MQLGPVCIPVRVSLERFDDVSLFANDDGHHQSYESAFSSPPPKIKAAPNECLRRRPQEVARSTRPRLLRSVRSPTGPSAPTGRLCNGFGRCATRASETTMHALVATSGTVGELYPLLSVAVELQKRKYVVSFAAQAYHKQKVEDAGIAFHALRPDVHQNTLEYMFSNTQEINSRVLSFHTSAIPETFEDLLLCSQGVDIIVSGALVFPPARLIAHMKGIPWINCVIYPDAVKPPPTTELLRYLAGGQLSSQDRTQFIKAAGRALHALCSTYHIAPPAMFSRPAATLALFSPCLINSEISDLVQIIGFPKYHGAISELPGELVGFLKAGTPPIVFALGTSALHA